MKKWKLLVGLWSVCIGLCACGKNTGQVAEISAETIEKTSGEQMESGETKQATQPIPETVSESAETESVIIQEPELSQTVPSKLQTLLQESFLAGTSLETIQPMVVDRMVEEPDVYRGLGIDETLDELEMWGGILLGADADNDGIEDLLAWIRDGGSSGNTSLQLARGKEDGSYEVTEYQGIMSQELAFIEYEGQNYLLETDYDYNRKAANGFIVTCFEQGRVSDRVYLEAVASEWEPEIISCASGYEALAEHYVELGRDGFHDESLYDYRVDAGSGEWVEKTEDTVYHADIDNDGVEEWYEKHIFYPSSIHVALYLEDALYFAEAPDQQETLLAYYDLQYEGTPLMFWVEKVATGDSGASKQVVCLLTYEGLSTNRIYGYLIEGDTVTEVFAIEYEGQLEWRN